MSDEQEKRVVMRVNVAGFNDAAVSLIAIYDPSIDMLVIAEATEYDPNRPAFDALCITTQDGDAHYDAKFLREEFRDAVEAFHGLNALGQLEYDDAVSRYRPDHVIQRHKIEETGAKYEIDPGANNGHVAVLAACLFARRQRGAAAVEDMMFQLMSI